MELSKEQVLTVLENFRADLNELNTLIDVKDLEAELEAYVDKKEVMTAIKQYSSLYMKLSGIIFAIEEKLNNLK